MTKQKARSTATSSTVICSCKSRRGATGLDLAPVGKDKRTPWACGECLKPIKTGTYLRYLTRCDDCLDEFSSPYEDICYKCYKIQYSDISMEGGRIHAVLRPDRPPYKGWAWAAKRHREGLRKLLESKPEPSLENEDAELEKSN